MKTIAIIANGESLASEEERAALRACDGCVCCDRLPPQEAPQLLQIVGDMDTCPADTLPRELCTNLHEDQETNDLTKAMRWVGEHVPDATLAFFCVTGKREDHMLANLSLIAEAGRAAKIYTPSGCFTLLPAGEHRYPVECGSPVSFISFTHQYVTVRGVQWPVEHLLLDSLWRATLNRCSSDCLTLQCEAPLYLYQPWRIS